MSAPRTTPGPNHWPHTLRALETGDPAALGEFARLVTTQLRALRAYDFRDDWDDLIQDVIWVVVTEARAGKIADLNAIPGFVKTVTWRKFRDLVSASNRYVDEEPGEGSRGPAWPKSPPTAPQRATIQQALDRLPEIERRIVVLLKVEQHSLHETARLMDLKVGTVRNHLARAVSRLRTTLESGDL